MHTKSGKVALVTGAARGLGLAFAKRLAEDGANVVAVDITDAPDLVRMLSDAGAPDARFLRADLTKEADVDALGGAVLEAYGRCDIVVNNAGFCTRKDFVGMPLSEWRATMAVNLDSMFLVAQQFTPSMQQHGFGRFINLTSGMLGETMSGFTHYLASKGAIIGFTRALANELGTFGITANCIAPALTLTPRTQEEIPSEHVFEMIAQQRAIKRPAQAEDYVGAMSFLASDDAAFITGQTFIIDGGLLKAI